MALVIEEGTGRADAQSYASVDTLKAYAKARGATVPSSTSDCEVLLVKAMDAMREGSEYLQGRKYLGERFSKEQALDWPRYNVCIQGFSYSPSQLPRQLEQAQCALAIDAQTQELLPIRAADASGPVIEETVGPVTVKYANSGRVSPVPASANANALLAVLFRRNGLFATRA